MTRSGVRVALRIAWRSARRSRGRSLLILAMIGTPMLALSAADVLARTAQLPAEEIARRRMGAADALVSRMVESQVAAAAGTAAELERLLPAGSRILRVGRADLPLRVSDGVEEAAAFAADVSDPLLAGMVRIDAGRAPRTDAEAAVTRALASAARVGVGGTLQVAGRDLRITGIAVLPDDLRTPVLVVRDLAWLAAELPRAAESGQVQFLVDVPGDRLPAGFGAALGTRAWYVQTRESVLRPPPSGEMSEEEVGAGVVAVGLATLEIVLLAGTAFAVGARRQRRELALVAAAGGDRADVRRIVLASGAVLGGAGGLLGIVGGIGVAALARGPFQRLSSSELGPFDVRPLELGLILLAGVGTGLLSAALPARDAARQDVVGALTGRRGQVRTPRRVTAIALVAIAVGLVLAWYGAGARMPGQAVQPRRADFLVVLAGAALAELGFVALASGLVGAAARAARRFPAPLRLAVRDAARHRSRSGPAVGAVCAALAGSVAMSVYAASDAERQRRDYRPELATGQVQVYGDADGVTDAEARAVAAALPTARVGRVYDLGSRCEPCPSYRIEPRPEHSCPLVGKLGAEVDFRRWKDDKRCTEMPPVWLVAGDAELVAVHTRADVPGAAELLRRGGIVVFDERIVTDGRVRLVKEQPGEPDSFVTVPAMLLRPAEPGRPPPPVMSPATARRLGLATASARLVIDTTRMPTVQEERRARALVPNGVYVERGFRSDADLVVLALLGGSLLVTLLATGIAVGLAAADSRTDLTTLAAVGAPPRVRRVLAGAQALTVSGIGSVLGLLAGLVPAVAVLAARADQPIVVPLPMLVVALVGVPLLASLPAALVTRSRLPVERRIA